MNRRILITRPNHDRTTKYVSAWADPVIRFASQKGDKVFDLAAKKATQKEVISFITKQSPELLFFIGHGSDDCVCGQDDEILFRAGENDHLLQGAIIYNLSCRSGKVLGAASIRSGARGFIGYKKDYFLLFDANKRTRPLEDKIAALFLEPSNQVVISLLKGHTLWEAYQMSQKAHVKKIMDLLTSEASEEETASIQFIHFNRINQVILGDNAATL